VSDGYTSLTKAGHGCGNDSSQVLETGHISISKQSLVRRGVSMRIGVIADTHIDLSPFC